MSLQVNTRFVETLKNNNNNNVKENTQRNNRNVFGYEVKMLDALRIDDRYDDQDTFKKKKNIII